MSERGQVQGQQETERQREADGDDLELARGDDGTTGPAARGCRRRLYLISLLSVSVINRPEGLATSRARVVRERTTEARAPLAAGTTCSGVARFSPRGGGIGTWATSNEAALKRVIVIPAVYPRLLEFFHVDIQSTGQKSHCVNTREDHHNALF